MYIRKTLHLLPHSVRSHTEWGFFFGGENLSKVLEVGGKMSGLNSSMLIPSGMDFYSSDEEPEELIAPLEDDGDTLLLWDARAASQSRVEFVDGGDSESDLVEMIRDLKIGIPQLDSLMMGIVVSFWTDDNEPKFVLQTDETVISREAMHNLCHAHRSKPFCIRLTTTERTEEDGDDDDEGDNDSPYEWFPESGYVNVLGVLYSQAPIIVGLHTEHYDMRDEDVYHPVDQETVDTFNNNGKRIRWMKGALRQERNDGERRFKRARGDDGSDVPEEDEEVADPMFTGFATHGNAEWKSRLNQNDVICAFEREADTGKLKEVRLALSLNLPHMRDELQAMLEHTRDRI